MKKPKPQLDSEENISIALDQVSQTIDVLGSTVERLKQCVAQGLHNRRRLQDNNDDNRRPKLHPQQTLRNNSIH
jgi:hypothetical protein